ncbi:MAG: DNA polymerase III subunit gamma/tau [Chromatiales bacterium]|nr:DNA polymerase III subunit gamma/tau [Chromatiales bacterium]
MTYLALARTWRPRLFPEVVGQAHVVRALENALDSGRVHHAFLFTGTRGVGKTTLARILAKALNCEQGVSSRPCGQCAACVAIEQGRFVDLIEVDAASRTGVDDTRELLDNVQYSPGSGRYKVYLVDEVHMLSRQAFNALLKTLEEPPPHVKFIFATTDPQKIPVTVLSRCLQFALKRLPLAEIAGQISRICENDGVPTEPGAVQALARAAAGSMRDALSLLDQAIAFGNGALRLAEVNELLGTLDRSRVSALLEAVAAGDAGQLLSALRQLDELAPDYDSVLAMLATLLQQAAMVQLAGEESLDDEDDQAAALGLAGMMAAEDLQLYYQIAVQGRRDLPLAPEPRVGFEMTLLRMLAFRPAEPGAAAPAGGLAPARPLSASKPAALTAARPGPVAAASAAAEAGDIPSAAEWAAFSATLGIEGAARQLALNSVLDRVDGRCLHLVVERRNSHLLTESQKSRLLAAVRARLGEKFRVEFSLREEEAGGTSAQSTELADERMARARRTIEQDPHVRELVSLFDAELIPESVREAGSPGRDKRPGRSPETEDIHES